MSKGIYHRGYLPHWDFEKSLQAVTFRLADSVPISLIQDWKQELASTHEDSALEKRLHQRIARYEDAGHGSSFLRDPACAGIVQNELISGHATHYDLIEWCVMPNHVHILIKLHNASGLSKVVQTWKGKSAYLINRQLARKGTIWQREYYDRYIRDQEHCDDCRAYIRKNPVKAKLCEKPEDWPYSSAGSSWMERRL